MPHRVIASVVESVRQPPCPVNKLRAVWDDVLPTMFMTQKERRGTGRVGPNGVKSRKCDARVKLVLLGDSGVGQTSLMLRYIDRVYKSHQFTTTAIDYGGIFITRKCASEENVIRLDIWDIAGQERFKHIRGNFLGTAQGITHAVMIGYDVNHRSSFDNVNSFFALAQRKNSADVPFLLVGNKVDVDLNRRKVTAEEGQAKAEFFGCPFMETSAKTGFNVDEAFDQLACMAIQSLADMH